MPVSPSTVESEPAWWMFAAVTVAILLAASNFLLLNEHGLLHLDSALASFGLIASGAIFAVPYIWRSRYWRAAHQALFVFLAIDLIANDLRVAAIAAAITALFVTAKNRSILLPACVVLGAMLASSLLGLGSTAPFKSKRTISQVKPAVGRPAIVHLILDEHAAIEGLQDPDGDAEEARAQLRTAYVAMGFRLYGRAFSEHLHTVNALPWVMNFGLPSAGRAGKGGARISQNRYFERLAAAGYRIDIRQTAFANFCAAPGIASCTTYHQQSLGALERYPFTTMDRAQLIYFKVLDQSQTLLALSHAIDRATAWLTGSQWNVPQSSLKRKSRSNTITGMAMFDDLITDLRRAKPGEAYVAHILLPHTPYIFRPNCTPHPFADWEDRDTKSSLQTRQSRYLEQVHCSALKVSQVIDALNSSPVAHNYVLVVHGDHGSRLTKFDPDIPNQGRYDAEDMVAGFSTLFAVKGTGIIPGYDPRPWSAANLLRQLVDGDFSKAPAVQETEFTVQLDDQNWTPRSRAPLPDGWVNSSRDDHAAR